MPLVYDNGSINQPLTEKKDLILDHLEMHRGYLAYNHQLFDIYKGNLLPYVQRILQNSLTTTYYEQIKDRIIPINVLKKLIDKLAKVYATNPSRTASDQQEVLDFYEESFKFNQMMNYADEYSQLFKGYALEPWIRFDNINGERAGFGDPMLRVLPFDRFFLIGEDFMDPTRVTIFNKIVGKKQVKMGSYTKEVMVIFSYSDNEFMAMTEDGDLLPEFMQESEGENPFGFIPFYFGSRSQDELMPTQDTDILQMSKMLPIQFSDLGGSTLFQCFSIIYGIDVDSENLTMSPNAFWNIKSDPKSEKNPQVGTIKPEADVDKVLNFIRHTFDAWMGSRGIKTGSMGDLRAGNMASGVSKIIDEMDTFEQRKVSIQAFTQDESSFWQLTRKMHNKWIEMGMLRNQPLLSENWIVETEFDEPKPIKRRQEELEELKMEVDMGFMSQSTAQKVAHPDWSEDMIEEEREKILEEREQAEALGLPDIEK